MDMSLGISTHNRLVLLRAIKIRDSMHHSNGLAVQAQKEEAQLIYEDKFSSLLPSANIPLLETVLLRE